MAFISKIAHYIVDNYDLKNDSIIVVFPNKRAALNLRSELSRLFRESNIDIWLPQMLSIQEAMTLWSELQMIDNIDLVYELINIINNNGLNDVNNNIFGIASQMLKDFDEIEQYDIDAEKLFNHLKDVKKLEMWTPDINKEIESSYIKFFTSLHTYYKTLRDTLLNNNCGYYGLISRKTNDLKDKIFDVIGDKKIIFAGFNAMTKTEEDVIVRLVESNKAVLLWDLDKYYFEDTTQEAGLFARIFFDKHPTMTPKFISNGLSNEKLINIISVSGNSIQANALQLQLNNESKDYNSTSNTNEAIVLADETLLIPVLNSLPKKYSNIQVTMGFPYSQTILNNFITNLFYLQENINNDKIYFWSLLKIIDSDFVKYIFSKDELRVIYKWKKEHLSKSTYYISINDFDTLSNNDNVYKFLVAISKKWHSSHDCINTLKEVIIIIYQLTCDKDNNNFINNQLSSATKIINKIGRLLNKYEQHINIIDIKTLYVQTALETNINLEGTRDGLQIMGLLETRNLDFDTLHILSVNEGILPQSKNNNSLIPYDLRIVYKLPTYKNKQAVYAYHFYRLLQNASTINIYYNTLADAMGEGEASRFILQLLNELPNKNNKVKINEITYKAPDFKINDTSIIEVKKNDDIIKKIKHMLTEGPGLSPTSMSCYLNCSLQFYLKFIEKIKDNTTDEVIQSNVIGSIIHDTFQNLYEHFGKDEITSDIFNEVVDRHLKESHHNALTKNKFPNGLPDTGFNYLNKMIMEKLINNFINFEREQLKDNNISILELEKEMIHYFYVNETNVKLSGRADRIDMIDNTIRVLDYKSGSVKDDDMIVNKDASTLDKLSAKSLQLIIYKYLYVKEHPNINLKNITIEPGIIGLRKLSNGIFTLNNNSEAFDDDNFIESCDTLFKDIFSEILNEKISFKQTDDEKKCTFCDFKTICKRNPKTY